jgi:hypothetical protein
MEPRVRRLAVLLVFTAACRSVPVGAGPAGADSQAAAVERFLAAARARDIRAMSDVWGDESGPSRDKFATKELERRELIMVCLLQHDQSRIAPPSRTEGGRYAMSVDLTQGALKATTKFTVAKGPSDRWYVQDFETVPLQSKGFCRSGR